MSSPSCPTAAGATPSPESAVMRVPRRIRFDRFTLLLHERRLLRDNEPVQIGSRAFELLAALAKRPGELVTKSVLLAEIWRDTFVEESNLRVAMAAVRKALGDTDARLIGTDPGRGYRFRATVIPESEPDPPCPRVASPGGSLPMPLTRLIGRDEVVARLISRIGERRLLSIVGPGGIGKTRVAIACAERLIDRYRDGVYFVDLTVANEARSPAVAAAEVMGIEIGSERPLADLLTHIRAKEALLVIDNCEHIVAEAAELVEAILHGANQVHVLSTSREPLLTPGEWVFRLPPLRCPPETDDLTAAEALRYAAVELFVERATASRFDFRLTDAETASVGEICRGLDGLALAIKLVALQVDKFPLPWLATHLHQSLWTLNRGLRTSVARHQTLGALFDWSYELLSRQERAALHYFAGLPGEFTLTDAMRLSTDGGIEKSEILDAVGGLVAKSMMITLTANGPVTRFRLLETTRAYACAREQGGTSSRSRFAEARHATV
jgi:predicted ATPase/DNA-binding winged helix-turn-helix (wHTH) protein